jgi:hypothetical protein
MKLSPVIPGRAERREPGIHNRKTFGDEQPCFGGMQGTIDPGLAGVARAPE